MERKKMTYEYLYYCFYIPMIGVIDTFLSSKKMYDELVVLPKEKLN